MENMVTIPLDVLITLVSVAKREGGKTSWEKKAIRKGERKIELKRIIASFNSKFDALPLHQFEIEALNETREWNEGGNV